MMAPLISVIVPVYNAERCTDAALRSVPHQRSSDPQSVIADDGSTNGTADRVAACGPPVRSRGRLAPGERMVTGTAAIGPGLEWPDF